MDAKFVSVLTCLSTMLFSGAGAQANMCFGAMTSEGPRDLRHDQRACAPLISGEAQSDLGQRFITCSFGAVHYQYCQPGLR